MSKSDNTAPALNKDEQFAIHWCYNRAMDYVEKHRLQCPNDPVYGERYDLDLVVNGVNINETIKNLIGRLFV
jgi:hypothetical protein